MLEWCTRKGLHGLEVSLTHKHKTRLEGLARDKHSSLLRKFVNYDRKEFYNIAARGYLLQVAYNYFLMVAILSALNVFRGISMSMTGLVWFGRVR